MITPFDAATILVSLVALAGWLNAKTIHIAPGVAMLIAGLLGALLLGVASEFDVVGARQAVAAVNRIDFSAAVTQYMLAFLLFAGAMQVNIEDARRFWAPIGVLATLGVVATTLVVGGGIYFAARLLSVPLSLEWSLVFGALISPTDPIAVLATLKHGSLSNRLKVILQAEALLNDGVGIVVFLTVLALATGEGHAEPARAILTVLVQSIGGFLFGLAVAFVVIRALGTLDEFAVETGMTVALAMVAFAGAQALSLSGAISVVGAGMLFGGETGRKSIAGETERYVRSFWTLVDEILNAILFLMLGIEMLVVRVRLSEVGLVAGAIVLVIVARAVVVLPWGVFYRTRHSERGAVSILTWGGLHGALSVALALSIPASGERSVILSLTYAVVAFSIVIQGLTFAPLARRMTRARQHDAQSRA